MSNNPDDLARTQNPGGNAGPSDNEAPIEDPLLELARIVHKNTQSGSLASGRVGATDYFAGLDDFEAEAKKLEPAPEPAPRQISEQVADQPVDAPAQSFAAPAPEPVSSYNREPEPQAPFIPAAPQVPDGPYEPQPTAMLGEPVEPSPVFQSREPAGTAPSAQPSIALDLEANLTAELEDELAGAFRQSISPERDQPDVFAPREEPAAAPVPQPASVAPATAPQQRYPEPRVDAPLPGESVATPSRTEPESTDPLDVLARMAAPRAPEPAVNAPPPGFRGAYSEPAAARDDIVAAPSNDARPTSQAPSLSVPAQDEPNETSAGEIGVGFEGLFADLERDLAGTVDRQYASAQQSAVEPAPQPEPVSAPSVTPPVSASGQAAWPSASPGFGSPVKPQDPNPAGVSAPPVSASAYSGPAQSSNYSAERDVAEDPAADDIDNMTWPAAASSLPQVDDNESPPPPGGYDLEEVARAMQESDPSLGGTGVLPPHSKEEQVAAHEGETKSRKGLYAAAAVIAVAVMGAGAFALYDGDAVSVPSGPPPIIAGIQEPLKVFPDNAEPEADPSSAKLIYDRVGGADGGANERLVLPETPEVANLPPAPAVTDGPGALVPGAPKRVRTVVVRPDGTIISDGSDGAETGTRTVNTVPVTTTPTAPIQTPTAQNPSGQAETTTAAVNSSTAAETPAPAIPAPAQPTPAAGAATPAESEPAAIVAPADIPSVSPRRKPEPPVQVARAPAATAPVTTPAPVRNDGPLDLSNPGAAAPAATTAAPAPTVSGSIPAGTYIVQVTSQRSEQAAQSAYNTLQQRFPSVLGSRSAVIVRADLADRGTFYRARIPTGSRGEAISLCENLKAAGGDCFVRQN